MPFLHKPGWAIRRGYEGYTETQDAKYRIFEDLAYSVTHGFEGCRMPTPGAVLPAETVKKRVGEVERGWRGEAGARSGNGVRRAMRASDLGLYHQQHLTERLINYPRTADPLQLKENF